jgi:hypothetical protein
MFAFLIVILYCILAFIVICTAGAFGDEYHVRDVPADGNCLFSSLALGLGELHTSSSVRNDLVRFLKDHQDEV